MAKERFRLQFKFWLDVNKADEYHIAELIDELKRGGAFSKAIRDGLRLIADLWRGNLDVLLTLFPWVEDAFYERFAAQQPDTDDALQQRLDSLEKLLLQQGNVPLETAVSGPKPLAKGVPKSDTPDDDLLVMRKAQSDGSSSRNFLDSAFSLVQ